LRLNPGDVDVDAFAAAWRGALAGGPGAAATPPRGRPAHAWLRRLVETPPVLLHGSNDGGIDAFVPRSRLDYIARFRKGVWATPDGIWPVFFAVVDRSGYRGTLRSACWRERRPAPRGLPLLAARRDDAAGALDRRHGVRPAAGALPAGPRRGGSAAAGTGLRTARAPPDACACGAGRLPVPGGRGGARGRVPRGSGAPGAGGGRRPRGVGRRDRPLRAGRRPRAGDLPHRRPPRAGGQQRLPAHGAVVSGRGRVVHLFRGRSMPTVVRGGARGTLRRWGAGASSARPGASTAS